MGADVGYVAGPAWDTITVVKLGPMDMMIVANGAMIASNVHGKLVEEVMVAMD